MFFIPWSLETTNIFLESHRVLWLLSWWENICNVKSDWTHCLVTIQQKHHKKNYEKLSMHKKPGLSEIKNLMKFLQQTFWNCCSTHKKLEQSIGNKTNAKFKPLIVEYGAIWRQVAPWSSLPPKKQKWVFMLDFFLQLVESDQIESTTRTRLLQFCITSPHLQSM